jgi:hypothetical protein
VAFEFEALVGHLYVVGGRAISTQPPGTLIEVAPRKAARGREIDTFFVLVLPGGDQPAPSAFYEQMAELAAEKYFNATGSVSGALRSVLGDLNDNLYEHNSSERRRYEARIICAVMRNTELYLARVGACVALYKNQRDLQPFPTSFDNDESLYTPPLGVQPVPDVKMANYQISTGARLLLGDAALADHEMPMLAGALGAANITAMLAALKGLMPVQMTLMGVEFVPPEVAVAVPVRPAESSRASAAAAPKPMPASTADPVAVPVAEVEPLAEVPRPRTRGLPLPVQAAAAAGARTLAQGADSANKLLERIAPAAQEGKKPLFNSPALSGAALFIPVLVVLLVFVLWVTGTGASEFDLCVQRAQETTTLARGIASTDVQGTISAWTAAAQVAAECQALRPDTPEESLAAISAEAQSIIDQLMVISRRDTAVVASFPQAGLTRGVLQAQDLYVLDDGNDQVYRITLNPDGLGMMPNTRQALAFMRRNVQLNEYQVGDLIDITWAEDGSGLSQPNVLVALDRAGLLIDCAPRFTDTCGAQQLLAVENWISPVAIAIWSGRLYVLDPGANQLWRYDPNGGAFANAPLEYFSGEGRPDIRTAVDFAIDSEGVVFILLASGQVLKFRGGDRLDFAFAGFPQGQPLSSAEAFFLNTNPLQPGLYIVSRASRAVYETLLGGTFVHNFRARNESYFESLSDVIVNNDQNVIYVLSGNSIFAFGRDG